MSDLSIRNLDEQVKQRLRVRAATSVVSELMRPRRIDARIASSCRVHRAGLATRNSKDFAATGIELTSWQDA